MRALVSQFPGPGQQRTRLSVHLVMLGAAGETAADNSPALSSTLGLAHVLRHAAGTSQPVGTNHPITQEADDLNHYAMVKMVPVGSPLLNLTVKVSPFPRATSDP